MTANLSVNYRKKTPMNELLIFESKIERIDGKKIIPKGKITSLDGKILYSDGTGLWIETKQMDTTNARSFL